VILCSGKVYFELAAYRRENRITDVAIVRLEQLYPFPHADFKAALAKFPKAKEVVWCQEEPQNQGAWYQIRHRLHEGIGPAQDLLYAGREPAAAPATGIMQLHNQQQRGLVGAALTATTTEESNRETSRLRENGGRKK
jgi:2-oxoglutarate dehydrogenase E1 component